MRRIIFILGTLLATIAISAQQTVTVQAQSYQVSDNLDLEAVAITFGESKNIEDFERRLNDPENRISNLDLNNDGYVDFLRVVEVEEKGTHLIVIQAVIGRDFVSRRSFNYCRRRNQNIYNSDYRRQSRHLWRQLCHCTSLHSPSRNIRLVLVANLRSLSFALVLGLLSSLLSPLHLLRLS